MDASIAGVSLPDEAIQTVKRALGLTSKYQVFFFFSREYSNSACKYIVSYQWGQPFTTIAPVFLFVAASRISRLKAGGDSQLTNKGPTTSNANPDVT